MVLTASKHEHTVRAAGRDRDFQCASCGYGVSRCVRLPVCPMCHQRVWRSAAPAFRGWVGGWASRASSSLAEGEELGDVFD
jgi:hypothetical protein